MYIYEVTIYLILIVVGLCLGSFAGASVWRLRARQLEDDKKNGESIDDKEYKKLKVINHKSFLNDRSRCLKCGYVLSWYDMIPLFSWLSLIGRCRKCGEKIGIMEPMIEFGLASYFVLSYAFWPYGFSDVYSGARFILWLIAGVIFAVAFFYDKKWFLLPSVTSFGLATVGFLHLLVSILSTNDRAEVIIGALLSVLILSGLYLLLYKISNGRWIGFGDIQLGFGLALFLPDWKLAFLALFAANLVGCLMVLPGLITKKINRNTHVPFGPFLIIGAVVAYLFGGYLLNGLFLYLI